MTKNDLVTRVKSSLSKFSVKYRDECISHKIKARLSNAQSREIHLLFSLTFSIQRPTSEVFPFFIETTMAFNHGDETEPFDHLKNINERVKEIFGKIYTNYTQISVSLITFGWKGIESKWKFLERSFAATFVVIIVILQKKKKKKDNARIFKISLFVLFLSSKHISVYTRRERDENIYMQACY